MPRRARSRNIALSVTHEVFDDDEESEYGLKQVDQSDQTPVGIT